MKGDSDYVATLHHRAARIARVDGRIHLDGQMLIHPAVAVRPEINAADDAARDRNPVAADRVSDRNNFAIQEGQGVVQWQRGHAFERPRVFQREQGEVAVMGDELDFGEVGCGVIHAANDEAGAVADDVSIGQESVWADKEAGAGAARWPGSIPWGAVIRLDGGIFNADDACVLLAERVGLGRGLSPERGWGSEQHAGRKQDKSIRRHPVMVAASDHRAREERGNVPSLSVASKRHLRHPLLSGWALIARDSHLMCERTCPRLRAFYRGHIKNK